MAVRIEPEDRFLRVGGLRRHYIDWGNEGAPPLLFLHGLSSHARSFDPFAAMLQPHYHALALDQRGHGDSDWAAALGEFLGLTL